MGELQTYLPIVYLGVLLVLVGTAAWFVFRQIWRTRRIESTLGRLQRKLSQAKGTAQEHFELGTIYLNKKLAVQAIAQFQQALKALKPEEAAEAGRIYNALGYAYFLQEQYDMAIRQYKEALQVAPDYATAWNNLGHAYERKSLTRQALEAYEEVLKRDANNPIAQRRLRSLRKVVQGS